jgi:hypothetical protein
LFNKTTQKLLLEAKKARKLLSKKPGIIVHRHHKGDKGLYLSNFANCLLNRQIDIFDDTIFLLEDDRIQSACSISRGMVETYAFANLLNNKVYNILTKKKGEASVECAVKEILKFTNSSRFKETEQTKVKKGILNVEDYHFTEQAKYRMDNMLAGSEHVMNALRYLYKREIEKTKAEESHLEQIYDMLSEWVHPSQVSLFTNYVPDNHFVPTSEGVINIFDGAKAMCVQALHIITGSMEEYEWSLELAEIMTNRSARFREDLEEDLETLVEKVLSSMLSPS